MLIVLGRPLASSLTLDFRKRHVSSVCLNILYVLEGNTGHEAGGIPRMGNLSVKLVDLLESKALGLVDHGPDEEDADEAASAPDEEDFGSQVCVSWAIIDNVWRGVTNSKVE
jgi:hypothetical protein